MQGNTVKSIFFLKLFELLTILNKYCPDIKVESKAVAIITDGKKLCSFSQSNACFLFPDIFDKVISNPGELKDEDEYLDLELQIKFLEEISKKGEIIRLNHIGFCYPVASFKTEKEELLTKVTSGDLGLYEMPSNDYSNWYFIGDLTVWRDPMIEIMPVEGEIEDKEIGWWLPHIHFDIDTSLDFAEIKLACDETFKGLRKAMPLIYDGYIPQARIWQGVISGINIHLDIGTSIRSTRYVRKVLMTKL